MALYSTRSPYGRKRLHCIWQNHLILFLQNPLIFGKIPEYLSKSSNIWQNPLIFGQNPLIFGQNPLIFGQNPLIFGKITQYLTKSPDIWQASSSFFPMKRLFTQITPFSSPSPFPSHRDKAWGRAAENPQSSRKLIEKNYTNPHPTTGLKQPLFSMGCNSKENSLTRITSFAFVCQSLWMKPEKMEKSFPVATSPNPSMPRGYFSLPFRLPGVKKNKIK